MIKSEILSKITAYLHRNISREVIDSLKELQISNLYLYSARCLTIEVKKGLLSLLPGRNLAEDPFDVVSCLVTPEMEEALINLIIEKGCLNYPGRGSVLAEEVELARSHNIFSDCKIKPVETAPQPVHLYPCTGICCIMKRGQGDIVARTTLDTGTCVPSLHFGTGTGVRDKMGLLRITIPPEKEIIHVFPTPYEADHIMEMMIDAGRLDQPGSGFIYAFPNRKGLVNTRVSRGEQYHAASIEQIIAAVDHIKGNTEWRRRRSVLEKHFARKKKYITGLIDLILMCDGGTGAELVKAAMSAGAGGATISAVQHVRPADSTLNEVPPARDMCNMVIPEGLKDPVMTALRESGTFSDRCHGQVHIRRISKAFTYQISNQV